MKILSRLTTSAERGTASAKAPPKVCMHVLGKAGAGSRWLDARVMREATALVEAGFELTLVDVTDDRTRPGEESISGVRIKHIFMPGWFVSTRFKPWFLVKSMQAILCGIFQLTSLHADIYHAHDADALLACYITARLLHKPLVFDSHELPFCNKSITGRRRLYALARYILIQMLPRCAKVITASPLYAQEISKIYGVKEVMLVRNVPPYQSVPKSDRLRHYLGLDPEKRIALYQGVLQPNRSLDRLIRAAVFLEQNIHIVLMGMGPKETVSQLEALILNEKVSARVTIIPPVPYEELLTWTASADIGLNVLSPDYSLSIQLCLPNKLFEYMMAGVPVLTTQLEAVEEIVQTYDVGRVVSSAEPEDIAAAVNLMLADVVALASMRSNALEAARQEFHWESESQKLIQLYHTILSR